MHENENVNVILNVNETQIWSASVNEYVNLNENVNETGHENVSAHVNVSSNECKMYMWMHL